MANTSASLVSDLRPNFDSLHGTERQYAYVKYCLPKIDGDELAIALNSLSTMEAESDEYIALRNKIVEGKLEYAYAIASKYAHRFGTANVDDVYQWASIGLLQSVVDYAKNGDGRSFLAYAKTAICNAIRRHGITPLVKCGIVGGKNPSNKKHNKETDEKRQEKGLAPTETVSVVADEQTDEDGKKTSITASIPSDDASPIEKAMEAEREQSYQEALDKLSTLDRRIYGLRIEKAMEWEEIGKAVGLKMKATQMRFYAVRDRLTAMMANADA